MNRLLKRIKKDKKPILIALISLIALIIGSFIINFIPSLLLVVLINLIIFFVSKPKKKKKNTKETIKTVLIVCFCCAIFVLLSGIGFFVYIVSSAKEFNPETIINKESSVIYDKDGNEVLKLGTELRANVTYDQVSQALIDAVIATEDSRYFQHSGVDLPRFLKASAQQLLGRGGGGASTITMQVSKLTQTSTEDKGLEGIVRKFTDIYMSVFEIERRYTKEQILEFYLNYNNMGGQNRGVQQASLTYFGKPVSEVNVAEAAMLAGLFQAPGAYNPYQHPEACENRRKTVLGLMLRHGYISQEEYDIALELTVDKLLVDKSQVASSDYQDYIETVIAEVTERTGNNPYEVPMKIYTNLDRSMQEHMNGVMDGSNYKWPDENIQGSSVVVDVHTGAVVAIGAGRNRANGWNYAIQNKRQIGSTAKPLYDYGPGIEYKNWSTYTPFTDEPYTYSDGKKFLNFDKSYKGFTTLHNALKWSRNVPAVKAFQQVGPSTIKQFVTNLGLNPEAGMYETHAIGGYNGESPWTVAAAYAAFSNGGYYYEPHTVNSIEYIESGKTVNVKPITRKVMSEATAYMLTKVLEDTAGYAVGLSVNGVNYCAKTGTTDLPAADVKRLGLNGYVNDKWIASFNDSYSVAVWLGYKENNKETYRVNSFGSIKTLFQTIAKGVYKEKSNWEQPEDVLEIEVENGLPEAALPSEYTPSNLRVKAYFKKGFEPTNTSERFSQLANVTNLNFNEATNTLSWDAIATPKFIDQIYLTNMCNNMYTDQDYKNKCLNEYVSYNNSNIGTVSYNIYTKNADGTLTLVTNTGSTSYQITPTGTTTFVVKTTYTIFKDNMSSGAEFTVQGSSLSSIITSELNGDAVVDLAIGDAYTETNPPVIVLENGTTDVTGNSQIAYSILRHSDNALFSNLSSIDTSQEETYTISYIITYKDYHETITRVIHIKENTD